MSRKSLTPAVRLQVEPNGLTYSFSCSITAILSVQDIRFWSPQGEESWRNGYWIREFPLQKCPLPTYSTQYPSPHTQRPCYASGKVSVHLQVAVLMMPFFFSRYEASRYDIESCGCLSWCWYTAIRAEGPKPPPESLVSGGDMTRSRVGDLASATSSPSQGIQIRGLFLFLECHSRRTCAK